MKRGAETGPVSLFIGNIPALLWGDPDAEEAVVGIHGHLSDKSDAPMRVAAETVNRRGKAFLSFDLPAHGARKGRDEAYKAKICIEETREVLAYARRRWRHIGIFAVSMGAYFALAAGNAGGAKRAFFLSPVVDMRFLLENMMKRARVSQEELCRKGAVFPADMPALYYEDYLLAQTDPVRHWNVPTCILHGKRDEIVGEAEIFSFAARVSATVETAAAGHWFHTPAEMNIVRAWLDKNM